MQFTEYGQTLIRDTVRADPLGPLEYRRVKGLGPMYIARKDAPDHDHFPWLMMLDIDDAQYKLCWKKLRTAPGSPDEKPALAGKPRKPNKLRLVK